MKQRFSSLDVKVIAHELSRALVSLRIANIYDLSSRIFLFKCAKPGARQQLLVDSGFRCHLTAFSRAAASAPSAFVTRLRKYLKSRRITSVTQIGTDRVVEIAFSDGQYRLFLEFFAAGNIILTDKDYTVLGLLRQVAEGDEDVDVKLGSKYVLTAKQNFNGRLPLSQERVRNILEKQIDKSKAVVEAGGKKAKRNKSGDDLKKALSIGFPEYPAHLLDHAFRSRGVDLSTKPEAVLQDDSLISSLMKAIEYAEEVFQSLDGSDKSMGYIVAKVKDGGVNDPASDHTQTQAFSRTDLLYDDFHPFRPSQFEGKPDIHIIEIQGFNKTVDEFYSSIESQKVESRLTEREEKAQRKLATAKAEHEKRLGALQHVQEVHVRKAEAIEANTHRVEEAIGAMNGLIAQGMDWMDIGKLIENEQARNNAVAQMVKLPLKLYENTVTLLLDEGSYEEDSDEEADVTDEEPDSAEDEGYGSTKTKPKKPEDKRLAIDIDLALSPWSNARQYYDQKKTAAVKEQKTVQASQKALKSTEKKIEADLKKGLKQEKQSLRPARRAFWFEKFIYFISSDGYLVLGGKDAQQNELLYRRYLKKGDIYVHADLQGAASVIVKNNLATPDAPIPPSTLSQAGGLSVCTSSAWDSKAVMAAWWVNTDQVSKTAPTGEYLTTGGFMIRGKKNFLPPSQLLLGFGVMFQITEESKVHHNKHRLQHTTSTTSEGAKALAGGIEDMSVQDDELDEDDAVPDLEEAADEAEREADDNADVHNEKPEVKDDGHDSDPDGISETATNPEVEDVNPLQSSQPREAHTEPREDTRNDNAPSEAEDQTDTDQEPDEAQEEEAQHQSTPPQPSSITPSNTPTQPKSTQAPRGKRTKAKRAAQKYANQDADDRALAMQLLGSAKAAERAQATALSAEARAAKSAADKERRRAQHDRAAQAERVRQENRAAGLDVDESLNEQDAEVLEQERRELGSIDALVGTPMPGDEIICALPVAGPWGALGRCKYKVKLQPGAVKKGKAVREIVGRWSELGKAGPRVVDEKGVDREKVWPGEVEAIRQWRVEEVVGCLPVGRCRVVLSQGLGGGNSGGGGGGGKGKGGGGTGARGGRGSKKAR